MAETTDGRMQAFLHYGYEPVCSPDIAGKPWMRVPEELRAEYASAEESDLVQSGIEALRSAFADIRGDSHVVPISGGLDSRIILAALVDAGFKDKIIAVTFGTPKTLDYEIGRLVAERAGVRHESVDLNQVVIAREQLENVSKEFKTWHSLFDACYNRLLLSRFGKEALFWSGFMGEALTGAHLPAGESETFGEAKRFFARWNRFANAVVLTRPGFQPEGALPEAPFLEKNILGYDDQLDFGIRQQSYIGPTLMAKGYTFRTPFLSSPWVSFILSVPRRYRENQDLYKKIAAAAFPDLFSLPLKNCGGLPLGASRWQHRRKNLARKIASGMRRLLPALPDAPYPMINYIDFDGAFRSRGDFTSLAKECASDLKKRGIIDWLDPEELLKRHENTKTGVSNALMLLISLEINLSTTATGNNH